MAVLTVRDGKASVKIEAVHIEKRKIFGVHFGGIEK